MPAGEIVALITAFFGFALSLYTAVRKAQTDKALADLQAKQAVAQKERERAEAERASQAQRLEEFKVAMAAAETTIGMMRGVNDELAEANGRLIAQNGKLEKAIDALREENREYVRKFDDLQRAVEAQDVVLVELKHENLKLEAEVCELRDLTTAQAAQIHELEAGVAQRDLQIEAMDAKLAEQTATIETLKQQGADKDEKLLVLRTENTQLRGRIERLENGQPPEPREIE